MKSFPFFFTWSTQEKPLYMEIDRSNSTDFIHKNKKVIELSSVSFQASFGLKNVSIQKNIANALKKHPVMPPKGVWEEKTKTTKKILSLLNLKGKIFYTVSGAEAVENAIKIARDIRKSKIVLARKNSYHGATLGALGVTGDWRNEAHQTPSGWVKRIPEPANDPNGETLLDIVSKVGSEKIAAICIETTSGINGVFTPPKSWWNMVKRIQKDFGIFVILDEVICGFYRTGKPFGFHHFNIKPDLVCMSKAITGGFVPFGAVFTSSKIAKYYETNILACGLTSYAHPLGIAAAEAVCNICEDKSFLKNLPILQQCFKDELYRLKLTYPDKIKEIRQMGFIAAIETNIVLDKEKFLAHGISVIVKDKSLFLAPALTMSRAKLKSGLKKLAIAFKDQIND